MPPWIPASPNYHNSHALWLTAWPGLPGSFSAPFEHGWCSSAPLGGQQQVVNRETTSRAALCQREHSPAPLLLVSWSQLTVESGMEQKKCAFFTAGNIRWVIAKGWGFTHLFEPPLWVIDSTSMRTVLVSVSICHSCSTLIICICSDSGNLCAAAKQQESWKWRNLFFHCSSVCFRR